MVKKSKSLDSNTSFSSPLDPKSPLSDTHQQTHPSTQQNVISGIHTDKDNSTLPNTNLIQDETMIWGTTISIKSVLQSFKTFVQNFSLSVLPLYKTLLETNLLKGEFELPINLEHVYEFDQNLYFQIIQYPAEMIKIMDKSLGEIFNDIKREKPAWPLPVNVNLQSRPFNCKHFLTSTYNSDQSSNFDDDDDGNINKKKKLKKNVRSGKAKKGKEKKGEVDKEMEIEKTPVFGSLSMRQLNPKNIDTLVTLRGLVIRVGKILPDLQRAFYICENCRSPLEVDVERDNVVEPSACPNETCGERNTLKLLHLRSRFGNKQLVKIQEVPENVPSGETPLYVDVLAFETLVDKVRPGDRVEVTGIYRIMGVRKSERRREVSSIYKAYLDACFFEVVDSFSGKGVDPFTLRESISSSQLSSQKTGSKGKGDNGDVEKIILELSKKKNIKQILINSLAPSIFKMEAVKKGILCLLFGGRITHFSRSCLNVQNTDNSIVEEREERGEGDEGKEGKETFRSEINILLCGDPGTSKSQLLQYVHKVAPRGIYTSGKGTSAVGLTAYVSRDPSTSDFVLESGALVLSDLGVCCIDEFDKMGENARSIMHEAMEQQTVSLAKAGIICSLNARTSVLAAANPRESRYNANWSVVKNLRLPPSLVSRFDLIFLVLDKANEENDRKLAEHIISLYPHGSSSAPSSDRSQRIEEVSSEINGKESGDIIDTWLFKKYVNYARRNVFPRLSVGAKKRLEDSYIELRSLGSTYNRNVITATPRQLESLIRIAESLAKMELREVVTEEDVDEALALVKSAMHSSATDPKTGLVDIDLITTGKSALEREALELKSEKLLILLEEMKASNKFSTDGKELLKVFKEKNDEEIDREELNSVLKNFEVDGIIKLYPRKKGVIKIDIIG